MQDQGNPQVRTQTTKLAWIRDPRVPQGQPALGTFRCPCDGVIGPVPFGGVAASLGMAPAPSPQVHKCPGCGSTYDSRGWLVSEASEQHACANCGRAIRPHRPSHMPDKSTCWVHGDTNTHSCSGDLDGDEMAEPLAASEQVPA